MPDSVSLSVQSDSAEEVPSSGRSGSRAPHPVKALQHAVDVLEALAQTTPGQGMGVSELARKTGLSKTATYNILTTFEMRQFVAQDPQTSRYRLSWRLYELGQIVASGSNIVRLARPYLEALAQRTGETALLGVLQGTTAFYLDYCESPHAIRYSPRPGTRLPLHATATGRVLLAYQSPQFINALIAAGLQQFSPYTNVDGDQLLAELRQVRVQGYATAYRDFDPDHYSIAAPVRNHTGEVEAALGVAGPFTRVEPRVQEYVPLLLDASAALGRDLGSPAAAHDRQGM